MHSIYYLHKGPSTSLPGREADLAGYLRSIRQELVRNSDKFALELRQAFVERSRNDFDEAFVKGAGGAIGG